MHSLDPPLAHGDLKPANILVTPDWTLVLTDFGLAARMPLGVVGGTLSYQAAESITGNPAGLQNDIFAVGIIWYEMLTGRNPFEDVGLEASAAGDERGVVREHLEARKWEMRPARPDLALDTERIPPPSESNPEFAEHPRLEKILRKCLAYRQTDRYANARMLMRDLRKCMPNGPKPIEPTKDGRKSAQVEVEPEPEAAGGPLEDAGSLLRQSKAQEALARAEEALTGEPASVPWRLVKAEALAALKRLSEAEQVAAEAQKAAPKEPDVYETMAIVLEAQGKHDAADRARKHAEWLRQGRGRPAVRRG